MDYMEWLIHFSAIKLLFLPWLKCHNVMIITIHFNQITVIIVYYNCITSIDNKCYNPLETRKRTIEIVTSLFFKIDRYHMHLFYKSSLSIYRYWTQRNFNIPIYIYLPKNAFEKLDNLYFVFFWHFPVFVLMTLEMFLSCRPVIHEVYNLENSEITLNTFLMELFHRCLRVFLLLVI